MVRRNKHGPVNAAKVLPPADQPLELGQPRRRQHRRGIVQALS